MASAARSSPTQEEDALEKDIAKEEAKKGKKTPKCHETDAGCSIMSGMRGGELTLPKLLRHRIVLSKRREDLTLLKIKLSFYNTNMRIAQTRPVQQANLTQQFINTNKMTPAKAKRKVDIELPSVEAKLRKVMELLNRSSKDLAINPPSSLSPAASASASAAQAPPPPGWVSVGDVPTPTSSLGDKLKRRLYSLLNPPPPPSHKSSVRTGGKRKTHKSKKSKKSKTRKTRKTRKSKTHKKSKKSKKSKKHKKRVTRKKII